MKNGIGRGSEEEASPDRTGRAAAAGTARGAVVAALLAFSTAALPVLTAGCGGEGGPRFLSVATAGTGGIYYPLGGALASRLSVLDSARRYTAEVTGGSVENVNRVHRGEVDLALAIGTTVYEAHRGGQDFETALSDLRVVAPLYPNATHVLVAAGSSIDSVSDLRGRRVSVGPPGSGTEQLARQLLAAHGLGYGEVREEHLSFAESSAALRDGALDAAILSVGYPASAVLEAGTSTDIRLLPIAGAAADRLVEERPYYFRDTIPAGIYPGVDEPVPTLSVRNWIVATERLEAEVVELVLRILTDEAERDRLAQVNDIARQIDSDALGSAPVPLHPAAAAWLREREAGRPTNGPPR